MATRKKMSKAAELRDLANAMLHPKAPRQRSPNYPLIDLKRAVECAEMLYQSAKTHYVPLGIAQEKWGYTQNGAVANQSLAAIKSFGLVDVVGAGAKREVRVSEVARHIILNGPDRTDLLKRAALNPEMHAELWKKYASGGLPQDDVLRAYLVFEKGFNEKAVASFISQFRNTIAFAGLTEGDIIATAEATDQTPTEEKNDMLRTEQFPKTESSTPPPGSATTAAYNDFPVYLSNNRKGILRLPAVDNEQDYGLLDAQIQNALSVLRALAGIPDKAKSEQSGREAQPPS